jgi:DNA invertase Pin-like site-specific DNA recombinase
VVTLRELTELGIGFVSLTEALDLTTSTGRAMAGMLAVFAEFERGVLRERVGAGIAQARWEGRRHGRPRTASLKADEVPHLKAERMSHEDTASGGKRERPGLERVQETLRNGDVLAVRRLDWLGRSLKHLVELMAELEGQGVGFHSVTESIDTTTPGGKLVFHILGALAEFERILIRERTYAGLAAARARGRKGGRRIKLGEKQRAVAVDLYRQKKHSIDEICRAVGISRSTLYKYVAAAGDT